MIVIQQLSVVQLIWFSAAVCNTIAQMKKNPVAFGWVATHSREIIINVHRGQVEKMETREASLKTSLNLKP